MSRVTTQPDLKNSLKFCCFLLDEEESLHRNDNETWAREAKAHKDNLKLLLKFLDEGKEDTSMEMSRKSYEQAEKTFGKALAARLFANVKIIDGYVAPVNAEKLFEAIKSKSVASRTKKAPAGFFTENAATSFEAALFRRQNGTNGYKDGKKDWPKLAVSFAELRQAKVQGELSTQFQELANNILMGSEYSPEDKARLMANLVNEYSNLSREGK